MRSRKCSEEYSSDVLDQDYELLFTVPLAKHDDISALPGIRIIGHITAPSLGAYMITRDGAEIELNAQGWNSLSKENRCV